MFFALVLNVASQLTSPDAVADSEVAATSGAPAFSIMHVLQNRQLHDTEAERWAVYGQLTYISSFKLPFHAPYTDLGGTTMSLEPSAEHSFTGTFTLYAGLRLWQGGEIQVVPEVIALKPLSHLAGLGSAIQNFELQKTGSELPTPYLSRAFLRQSFNLGGAPIHKASGEMQLGSTTSSRRIVLTVGKLSILDVFDKNSFAGDLRNQYLNMAFMTHAAFDFAADARGYSWGGMLEFYVDDWALRFGHMQVPIYPNQLALDMHLFRFYGEQIELEHSHTIHGLAGAVRIVAYRNVEKTGRFDDALTAYQQDPSRNATSCPGFSYGSHNAQAPDLCWARRPNVKMGIGLNIEQSIAQDIGVFLRGMLTDGDTEVYSYTSTDQSLSLGLLATGSLWHRARDVFGLAYAQGFISRSHAAYLDAGGVDGFIGDGRIRRASERVIEIFYSVNVYNPIMLTADYQHITNPAYNADRGPVNIFGVRLHAEF